MVAATHLSSSHQTVSLHTQERNKNFSFSHASIVSMPIAWTGHWGCAEASHAVGHCCGLRYCLVRAWMGMRATTAVIRAPNSQPRLASWRGL